MPQKKFDVISEITHIEIIAVGDSIRERHRLNRLYAKGRVSRWRKMKGMAWVRYVDGGTAYAEIHWYEAHGIGKQEMKVKIELQER